MAIGEGWTCIDSLSLVSARPASLSLGTWLAWEGQSDMSRSGFRHVAIDSSLAWETTFTCSWVLGSMAALVERRWGVFRCSWHRVRGGGWLLTGRCRNRDDEDASVLKEESWRVTGELYC